MAKNIVLCFDGTWNDPDSNTNVVKIYRSILGEDKSGVKGLDRTGGRAPSPSVPTIKWYDKGVGTGRLNRVRGGLTGRGIARNILQGYKFLVGNYESGDKIYLFGFSRGAYTARSLAGMIRNIGILHKRYAMKERVDDNPVLMNGFGLYQRRDGDPDTEEAKYFRSTYSIENVEISFLGVWDTVGAMGIPSNSLDKVDRQYEFHDTTLSRIVRNAYHALAIDETRPEFRPTLWASAPKKGQTLEQVWFAGVHSEVGGGKGPLTEVALRWMQEKAMANGLELNPDRVVRIDKEKYLSARVSDHFAWSWNPMKWYHKWAWVSRKRPHVRPIGGTPAECLHDLVSQKRAQSSAYSPTNQGLDSAQTCPDGSDESAGDE